jgi:glycosyltransferase involved in cell wall biosynthesis
MTSSYSNELQKVLLRQVPQELLPTFAVVIPSLNQGDFISQTLDSVFLQNYPNFEIFIADGGSSDDTESVISRYKLKYPGKIVFSQLVDGSHSAGVRRGIESTNGDIIAWINSDDVYAENAFWHVAEFFIFNATQFIVFGDNDYVNEKLEFLYKYPINYSEKIQRFRKNLAVFCQVPQPSLFFRRNLLEHVEGPKSEIIDYEMWLRWSRDFKFNYIPQKLSMSRLHPRSITMRAEKKLLNGIIRTVYDEFRIISYPWILKKHEVLMNGNFTRLRMSKKKFLWMHLMARLEWTLRVVRHIPGQIFFVFKDQYCSILNSAKR